jgi:hypothetical protein
MCQAPDFIVALAAVAADALDRMVASTAAPLEQR